MMILDDVKIVNLFIERDEDAILHISKKYGKRIRTLAYGIVGDLPTAEECENDTYMESWKSIPPHEPRDYLYTFLARITRNISLNKCKERGRLKRKALICELTAEMEECIPSPDDMECHIDDITLKEAINGFLETLSIKKRNVFLRRYWYLDSISSIANRYFLSQSNVKAILFRCRNDFRNYLEKEGYTL